MLYTSKISFPGLGIGEFTVKSDAFSTDKFSIAWYGIIICLGMILAVAYVIYRAKGIGIDSETILDFALFVIPIGVIGARLYYVLMELDQFDTFWEVINISNGGLAIYGGILAGAATVVVMCKIKKIYFPAFADCVVPGLIAAQAIGRWGNFMNGEAFGAQTTSFLRMGLQNINSYYTFDTFDMVYVHPTFLYESLWNIIGFIGVNIFYKHKKYDGQIFLMIFGWYGLGRMLIEGLRTDSLYLFGSGIRVSQALAALIFIACTSALIYFAIKRPNKPFYVRESKTAKVNTSLENTASVEVESNTSENSNDLNVNDNSMNSEE